eukprot:TRINITY_DN21205_c0_g1_i1.p1 TRINITY_DN21205_c0_g1~~TRINITY_DN21205_c0_g1_i1.p1  ORF type:complete len:587 (-),score=93.07 TRINITY_DN21205_c0_g1_i1:154-1914(-)
MALIQKVEYHLDALWKEVPPPKDTGEYLAQMVSCKRIEEPVCDASLPEVRVGAPWDHTPKLGIGDLDEYHCDGIDGTSPGAAPPKGLVDRQLKDFGPKVMEAVELHSRGRLSGQRNSVRNSQHTRTSASTESTQDTDAAVMEKASSKKTGQPKSIREREEFEESRARRLIKHPLFETAFACLIFINAVTMGLEQQFVGFDTGYKLGVPGYRRTASETWPQADVLFVVAENFFGIVFTFEVILKALVFRWDFFKSLWNLYDSVIIAFWLVQNLSLLSVSLHPMILRLARMGRLLRLLRFAKAFQVFDVLHLLVHSMMACMTALLWSIVFLLLVMIGTSIVMIHLMQEHLADEAIALDQRLLLYTYFGNFSNGLFSMYELTMGNWVPIARCIVDNVGDLYMIFFVAYRTLVGFAVLKVITAIFNSETFRVASSDDGIMMMHKERQIATHTRRMEKLLIEGDESQDGYLSLDEFQDLLSDPRVKKWLVAQEIEVKDVALAFKMIDDSGDGRVSAEELVRGFARLKGTARSMDMVSIIHAFHRLEVMMDRIEEKVQNPTSQCGGLGDPLQAQKRMSMVLKNNVSGAMNFK